MKQNIKIGAHLSTSGGVHKAIERAHAIGANCVQVFSGSPRMWRRTSLDKIDVDKVFAKKKELNVTPIFTHALYLVNLASDKPELLEKSKKALVHDLEFDSYVKGAGVVVHLGSHQGRGWEHDRQQVVDVIVEIMEQTPNDSRLLIENSAGQKGKLCSDLSEIRWLLDEIPKNLSKDKTQTPSGDDRLAWCFDTCHGHAAGYSLAPDGDSSVMTKIDSLNLWESLACVHINDSRDAFDSGRDRHANIGEGELNQADLKSFVQSIVEKDIPLILEVPGLDGKGPDAENIARVKALLE